MWKCVLLALLFVSACSAPGPNFGPGSIRLKHPIDSVEFWADPADEPTISVDGRRPTQLPSWPDFVPCFTKVVSAKWTPDARSIEVTFADGQQAILSLDWDKVKEAQQSSKKHYYLAPVWRKPGEQRDATRLK